MERPEKLTSQNKRFIEEYIANGYNQSAAYRKAYPNAKESTVQTTSNKILKKKVAIDYLHELQHEALEKTGVTPERLLAKLASMVFSDDPEYVGTQNHLRAIELMQRQMGITSNVNVNAEVSPVLLHVSVDDDE